MSGFTAPTILGTAAALGSTAASDGAPRAILAMTGVAFATYLIVGIVLLAFGTMLRRASKSGAEA